ncbi:hypothetical protein J3Q64DRAFT_1852055 [Phycomyces blakesleeanus]|uniref:Uncharacterized protein n=2 Tax=Phycomyces blakesleeanus TaxID=4837 RepID=A0A167LV31_PHYB8|nr:hypothetical protein PHYBLDRAFT_147663 [Phycomyces blakesleeanus NRRL 1555(-)]OAD71156.1 hypothetical protein PHYBLDRAFT_147663 [Phycomyces blakesleeanus NRRL 1555(-)]|eukprot:XP_018289196.1 hypothetical protein PHYBLDRAFT_147663 [Phycomyces blakesleeanus NRRL 1555(-)]
MANGLDDYDLVFGVDFGTINSGYYLLSLKNDTSRDKFDQSHLWKYKEEPSTMFYKKNSKKLFKYGELADCEFKNNLNSGYYANRVKMWLDRTIKNPALPPHLKPVEVIADYLKKMSVPMDRQLRLYNNIGDGFKWRYCMTVPNMWPEQSKSIMREAAILAGFVTEGNDIDKLLIIDEALAAALHSDRVSSELKLAHGSRFLICDAGGRNINISTFEKDNLSGISGLKEITIGDGGSCGSILLENLFEALLRKRMYIHSGYSERNKENTLWYFNYKLKYIFGGDMKKTSYYMKMINQEYIRGHPNIGEEEGISLDAIQTSVFDPVVNEVLGMIEKQLIQLRGKTLNAIFITGGFGQSPYLQKRMKETFKGRVKHFKVIEDGHEAVMKGAALFGFNPCKITQNIIRCTYGIRISLPSSTSDDSSDLKSEKEKIYVYIRKGESVNNDMWISRSHVWKNNSLPVILAIFNQKYPDDQTKEIIDEVLTIGIRFGSNRVEIKVNSGGRQFEYVNT